MEALVMNAYAQPMCGLQTVRLQKAKVAHLELSLKSLQTRQEQVTGDLDCIDVFARPHPPPGGKAAATATTQQVAQERTAALTLALCPAG